MIYADHAATTPLCREAREAMEPYLAKNFANPSGQYRFGLECRRAVELARRKIAECLHCFPEEIYFTSGGSEANTWAVWNSAAANRSCRLLTTGIEHHSLLNACRNMEPVGASTRLVPVDRQCRVDMTALADMLEGAALASIQYANNEVGTVQPMAEIIKLCQKRRIPLHTDAVQAVGHIPVRLEGVSLLTASAHKFGGPKGAGFLVVRRGTPLRPLICGGGQEQSLRGGTENVAAIVGMAAALEAAVSGMEAQREKLLRMEAAFRENLLAACPQAQFHAAPDKLPGLISVTLPRYDAEQLVIRMDIAGVCISAGAACDSRGRREPSHVLTAMGLSPADASCTIRVSFGSANQEEDGGQAAQCLWEIVQTR